MGNEGTILHYDGKVWHLMQRPTAADLAAVCGVSGGTVYAVGSDGAVIHYEKTHPQEASQRSGRR